MELFGELRGPESVALQNRVILLCSQLSSNLPKQRVSSLTCTLETKQSCRSPFEGLGLTMICRQKSWGSSEIQRWISQMTRLAGSGSCFCSGGCRAYQLSQKRCPAVCGSLALPHNVELRGLSERSDLQFNSSAILLHAVRTPKQASRVHSCLFVLRSTIQPQALKHLSSTSSLQLTLESLLNDS